MTNQGAHPLYLPFEVLQNITQHLNGRDLKNLQLDMRLREGVTRDLVPAAIRDCYIPDPRDDIIRMEGRGASAVPWINDNVVGTILTSDQDIRRLLYQTSLDPDREGEESPLLRPFPNGTLILYLVGNGEGGEVFRNRFGNQERTFSFQSLEALGSVLGNQVRVLHLVFPSAFNPWRFDINYQSVMEFVFSLSQLVALNLYVGENWNYLIPQNGVHGVIEADDDAFQSLSQLYVYGINGMGIVRKWFTGDRVKNQITTLRLGPRLCHHYNADEIWDETRMTNLTNLYPNLRRLILHDPHMSPHEYFVMPEEEWRNAERGNTETCLEEASILVQRPLRYVPNFDIKQLLDVLDLKHGNTLKHLMLRVAKVRIGTRAMPYVALRQMCQQRFAGIMLENVTKITISHATIRQIPPVFRSILNCLPNIQEISFIQDLKFFRRPNGRRSRFAQYAASFIRRHRQTSRHLQVMSIREFGLYYSE